MTGLRIRRSTCGSNSKNPLLTLCQLLNRILNSVQTEEVLKRFDYSKQTFSYNNISTFEWGDDDRGRNIFDPAIPMELSRQMLALLEDTQLRHYFDIAVQFRVESHVFAIFLVLLDRPEPPLEILRDCMEAYPSLAYCILKRDIPEEGNEIPSDLAPIVPTILRSVLRSANELGIASLVALELLASTIDALNLKTFFDLLWLAALSIRSTQLVQEVLLVLHDAREPARNRSPVFAFAHKHALSIIFDRVEEAADTCPCDDSGRPRRQRTAPARAKLVSPPDPDTEESGGAEVVAEEGASGAPTMIIAHTRIDSPTPIRIHNHVRLQLASIAEHSTLPPPVLDAIVTRATRGELYLDVMQPLPPEWREVEWNVYDAGGTATSAAMLAAVLKLAQEGYECCRINHILIGLNPIASGAAPPAGTPTGGENGTSDEDGDSDGDDDENDEDSVPQIDDIDSSLNASQQNAVRLAVRSKLCLIWGPPGRFARPSTKPLLISCILGPQALEKRQSWSRSSLNTCVITPMLRY